MAEMFWHTKFFQNLSYKERSHLESYLSERKLPKDGVLWKLGDEMEKLWVVKQGRIKEIRNGYNGHEVILQLRSEGEVVCLPSLFSSESKYTCCEAVAVVPSVLWTIPVKVFREVIKPQNSFSYYLITELSKELRRAYESEVLLNQVADQRVVQMLQELNHKFGRVVKITHEEIASLTGLSRETVSRILSDLQNKGVIGTSRGTILLHKF